MARDFYVVLGVGRGSSLEKIRKAFRARALECHPDHAGASSTREFLEVREAYDVLSDPKRRAAHDRDLARAERRGRPTTRQAPRPRGRQPDLELVLSRREARVGGALDLTLPVDVGGMVIEVPVRLQVPAGLHTGDVLEARWGRRGRLRLAVRVAGEA